VFEEKGHNYFFAIFSFAMDAPNGKTREIFATLVFMTSESGANE
jgi:hypothetical protein